MANFVQTIGPTPYGFFDSDPVFQQEADATVNFVKRRLGDDVLSVELTKKEIWACLEEATLEYSRQVNELTIVSQLANVLGMPTGSVNLTNRYPRQTLEFLMRQAEPYAGYAGIGGAYNATMGYITLAGGVQDYNLYTDLKDATTNLPIFANMPVKSSLKIVEVFHFSPSVAQQSLLNASNITNFLANNFNYESYVNSTVFYVLPVFEDVLRRGMLDMASRVRRSGYSYEVIGGKIRIYPVPVTTAQLGNLYVKVFAGQNDPLNPTALMGQDDSIFGVSGPSNVPLNIIPYTSINQPGRQWIRQYALALSTIILGRTRSKYQTIPIPNAELTLNGEALTTQGREDKDKLTEQLKEFLAQLTNQKLMEQQALLAESMQKLLKLVPMPIGKGIVVG
jgi:hypothetical protein